MTARKEPNTLFPGRRNYTGPNAGYFAMLHHEILFEHSAGVMERVNYVKRGKPPKERKVRLYNMLYLGNCPVIAAVSSTANRDLAPLVLAYIKKCIPDHSWDTKRNKIKGT